MSQITGTIYANGFPVGVVCNRNPDIDGDIRRVGLDPEEINYASTPLIGASRHAEITVLCMMLPATAVGTRPFDLGNAQGMLQNSTNMLYALRLTEPQAGGGASGTGTGDKPGGPGDGTIGTGPVDTGPPPDVSEPPTRPGTDIGPLDMGDDVPVTPRAAAYGTLQKFDFGRQMYWGNLTLVEAREILASVAGSASVAIDPGKPNIGGSLFVLKFVDARARFLGQTLWSMDGGSMNKGTIRDQWNMIADNPLHLVAATVKESTYFPPNAEGPPFRGLGVLDNTRLAGIPSPSGWYMETPWKATEIIAAYVSQVNYGALDRAAITYTYNAQANKSEKKGDMLNLDLRGKTIGECLDEIASRIGCVWVWNRYASQLILRPVDYGIPGGSSAPYTITLWLFWNAAFRCGGGLNQVTNDLPGRWATVHPIRYVSVYGREDETDVFVDWRSMATPDGVRHLSLESSDRPPLWYQIGTGIGRTQFVGDHLPAYYGVQGKMDDQPTEQYPTSPIEPIWNASTPESAEKCLWWSKPWAVTLEDRLSTIEVRYANATKLIDGEIVLNRMPAYGNLAPLMNESPCPSLQWDEVRFGMGDIPIQYRLFGSNTDTLLFPHLVKPDRVKAMGLGSTYQANGYVNLQRLERRGGIVRTFLAEFQQQRELQWDQQSGLPYMWVYRFKEVAVDNIADASFRKANEWGEEGVAAEGRALNLCEMAQPGAGTVATVPAFNFDGGSLRYNPASAEVQIVRASPRGIAPCYEYITPSGLTVFFIYAPPGIQVICPGSTTPLLNPAWKSSGASGVAFPDSIPLSGIVADTPAEQKDIVVGNLPPLAIDETTLANNILARRPNPTNPTGMP